MFIPLALLAVAVLVWGFVYARRAEVLTLALATVVVAYVLGHSFWNKHLGPLPLTLDRLLLGYTLAIFAWRWWQGQVRSTPLVGLDWVLVAYLALMSVSWFLSRPDETVNLPSSPFWRLLVSFIIPAALYVVFRQAEIDGRAARHAMWVLTGLGIYLGFTALAETAQQWWAVFPRYISDPLQGLHYGRARADAQLGESGDLSQRLPVGGLVVDSERDEHSQSDSAGRRGADGVCGAADVYAFHLDWPRRQRCGGADHAVAARVAIAGARHHGRQRRAAPGGRLGSVLHVQREDRGEVSAHSVQQRESFLYVSMHMFHDNPLWGVGFGRFYDQKMPYLSDRRQEFELESIRPLHHHNTFLGFLTETGMMGLALFLAVLGGFARSAWRLFRAEGIDPDVRRLSLWLLGTLVIYISSAAFHDLTLVASEEWLLFTVAGLAVGCERRLALAGPTELAPFGFAKCPSENNVPVPFFYDEQDFALRDAD